MIFSVCNVAFLYVYASPADFSSTHRYSCLFLHVQTTTIFFVFLQTNLSIHIYSKSADQILCLSTLFRYYILAFCDRSPLECLHLLCYRPSFSPIHQNLSYTCFILYLGWTSLVYTDHRITDIFSISSNYILVLYLLALALSVTDE